MHSSKFFYVSGDFVSRSFSERSKQYVLVYRNFAINWSDNETVRIKGYLTFKYNKATKSRTDVKADFQHRLAIVKTGFDEKDSQKVSDFI